MIKASSDGDRGPPGRSSPFVAPGRWRQRALFLKDAGERRISKHQMGSCNEKPKGGYTPEVLSYCKIALSKEQSEGEKKVFGFWKGNEVSEQKPIAPEGSDQAKALHLWGMFIIQLRTFVALKSH